MKLVICEPKTSSLPNLISNKSGFFLTSLANDQSVKSPPNLISLEFKLDESARQTEIKLDFLTLNKKYKAIVYQDSKTAHWENNPVSYDIKTIQVTSKSKIKLYLARGGGTAISFESIY